MTTVTRVLFVGTLVVLLAFNLVSAVKNQRSLPCRLKVCAKPRDLEHMSRRYGGPKVHSVKAVFHHLARRIPGAELTVPEWMARQYRWELEHVARVRVVVERELPIDPEDVDELRAGRPITRRWLVRGGSAAEQVYRPFMMLVDGGGDAFVMAEESREGGALVVLPADRYRELIAR